MRLLMIREIGIKTYRYSYRYRYEYMVEVDQILAHVCNPLVLR